MNWAHVHLIINHFPVIGTLGAILLLVYSLVRKSEEMKIVSFGAFVIIALMTLAVYFTGQAAEEVVKGLPGVTETYIGRHEEVASLTLALIELLGITSLAGIVLFQRSGAIPRWIVVVILLLSLITAVSVNVTANLGGQIRHTEIRGNDGSRAGPGTR